MNPLKILSEKEKNEIIEKLNGQFGIKNIPGKIITRGRERLFLYSGNLGDGQIKKLEEIAFLERVGSYFAKMEESEEQIRLSIEGAQVLQNQITKNIFEIPEELVEEWMKGNELNIKTELRGFVIIKYKNDFLGTGKASENKISNFIPKNRRLKEKSN
ncbi:hypothetical protein HY449_02830 [Candidatus Pacearchaeota archaeon]|nr:hypothetical protein [Candidatus Pacearchaeota archaeon]